MAQVSSIFSQILRFIALLRRQLFDYRDLFRFLDYPFEGPLILRNEFSPNQKSLFTDMDIGQQGVPKLSAKQKQLQTGILLFGWHKTGVH